MSTLELFDHPDSPNCRKVRLLLGALGLPHERRRIDLLAGGTREPSFLALNPRGQLPVLVHGGLVLSESNAILVYLADRFAPALSGDTHEERAAVLRWLFWQGSGATRPLADLGYERLIRPALGQEPDETAVARALAAWSRDREVLESHLERHDFVVDRLTVADFAIGVWIEMAAWAGGLASMPETARWLERLQRFDFWRSAPGYELIKRNEAIWNSSWSSSCSSEV